MKISIITLNYNGSKETLELLNSLREQTLQQGSGQADTDFEIIVVDNTSEKADFANLQTGINRQDLFKQVLPVNLIRNSENLGFSGGNNVGIRHALRNGSDPAGSFSADRHSEKGRTSSGASWVVLLNNDTWAEKGFIESLKAVLSVKRGVVGIPLIEGDPAPNLSADRHSPAGEEGRIWCGASWVAYCGKVQWLKPTLQHNYQLPITNYQIYAIGGAMAIHKNVFDKIGLLNEKYFLYFEDADFSVRARKAGFDISIAEDLSIHHHVSSSTKKLGSPLLLRYHYRNALYFNSENGPWYIKFFVWPWSLIIIIRQLGKSVINRNKDQSKAILAGVMDFYKNKMGKIK